MRRTCKTVAQVHTQQCDLLSFSPSPISDISPHVIPSQLPTLCCPSPVSPHRPQCVMLPSLCPCVIVQHPPISENMQYLISCSWVSLLRMMVSRFIYAPTKDTNSSFLWMNSSPWCICTTFSLSIHLLMELRCFSNLGYYEQCCNKRECRYLFEILVSYL